MGAGSYPDCARSVLMDKLALSPLGLSSLSHVIEGICQMPTVYRRNGDLGLVSPKMLALNARSGKQEPVLPFYDYI